MPVCDKQQLSKMTLMEPICLDEFLIQCITDKDNEAEKTQQ